MKWLIDFLERNQMPCQWKSLTGIDCFGCGMQRSIIELLKGNIWESIQAFPALIPLIVSIFLLIVHLSFNFKRTLLYFKISIIFTFVLMFINFFYKLFFLQTNLFTN